MQKALVSILISCFVLCYSNTLTAQLSFSGTVLSAEGPVLDAHIFIPGTSFHALTDVNGKFNLALPESKTYNLKIAAFGFDTLSESVSIPTIKTKNFYLRSTAQLEEVVISGTLQEVSKLESPVPVEVYCSKFFKANPTPSLFDALQNINGVRPQVNCNVCNTGDIHMNGLEGPYSMIVIDGMPIVSGLASVYGLSGIPQALIDRIEVVKGPASTLYGSEAVGGLINVITKKPQHAPLFSAEGILSSWGEGTVDIAGKIKLSPNTNSLLGINYFNYAFPIDQNKDGFTDLTLQNRLSVFNNYQFTKNNKTALQLAGRFVFEDRWGGQMNWNKHFRGGDSIYGENIETNRWELFGTYFLPTSEKLQLQFSANGHYQNSAYGTLLFNAKQYVAYSQLIWTKDFTRHLFTTGLTYRLNYYDDNTPVTATTDSLSSTNNPSIQHLPGLFMQDQWHLSELQSILLGIRFDYNSIHGAILSPRANYKWNSHNKKTVVRMGIGNGYRVANVFTEDHAALTGSRTVLFLDDLKPETSWNTNVNIVQQLFAKRSWKLQIDFSAFYTYFTNKIIADYDSNPLLVIYSNLNGHAVSQGIAANLDLTVKKALKATMGFTLMDVSKVENDVRTRQLFTERFSGVWTISYNVPKTHLSLDYTGNVFSPMRLPVQNAIDPRSSYSPWWSIQNIQITNHFKNGLEVFGGVKNLLNWTPNKGNPFLIARANDPFNKQVQYDAQGSPLATSDNPYALTFDPTYVYGPNQGIRFFFGLRYVLP